MSFRHLGLAAIGAMAAPAVLMAQLPRATGLQQNRAPDKDASQVMITSFKAPPAAAGEKGPRLGFQAAEEMRKKVDGAFPFKQVYVIPVEKINPQLEASMFPTQEGLEPHDAKALATYLRADEYVAGEVSKTATGFKVSADLVLTRDIALRQPLGTAEAPKLGDAINVLVKEMKEARKQMDGEKKCTNAMRSGQIPQAIEFANAAITLYPKSTLARICLASALKANKAPAAELAKVANELVAQDPRSNVGYRYLYEVYKADPSKSDSLVPVLTQMMRNEPKNAELADAAVNEIAASKNPGVARPIIDSAVALNPGDPDLMKTQWRILRAVKDYKAMQEVGKELLRLDTAFADTTYFLYTASALATDSQFQQAAAMMAQGLQKFPTNAPMAGLEIQFLQRAGQQQQALDKLNKAIAAKIPIPQAGAIKLQLLQDLKSPPLDIVGAAREAISAGDTTEAVRLIVYNQAAVLFRNAQGLISTDAAKAQEELTTNVMGTLTYLDSVATKGVKPNIAYLKGATHLVLGANIKLPAAQATKSCALAKEAQNHLLEAQINLPQGGAAVPAAQLQNLMGIAMQVAPQVDTVMKGIPNCK